MFIAQITDTHVVAKGEHWLNEPSTKTSERLAKAVQYLNHLSPQPDVVLLTGDVTDTGTKAAYSHLKELLQPLRSPYFVIPGNHDSRTELMQAFSECSYMPQEGFIQYIIDDFPVALIGLDTHVVGESFGNICDQRFAWLKQTASGISKPSLIFMHHPPTKVGHKVFDSMKCSVPQGFEEFIRAQNRLLGIVTGHYHHFCLTSFGNKPCFIAPSIAPVHHFANFQDDDVTSLELREPAITLHKYAENVLTSHIIYLKDDYQRIDWDLIKDKLKH